MGEVASIASVRDARRPLAAHCRLCASLRPRLEFARAGERRGELSRLARKVGIDRSQLSRIFNGESTPTAPAIVLLADALSVSYACIIRYPPIWHRIVQEMGGEQ